MSAVHYVPGDGNPTQDAEVKVPDSSVGSDPMIPVSDRRHLINFATDSSDEDSDDEQGGQRRRRRNEYQNTKWWFQEPTVKRNWYIVVGVWALVFLGIACIVTGLVLEIIRHTTSEDIIRGFIFFLVAAIVLIPGVYAVLHVYLAARRVGRVRFSSVWFFR